jgi:hypothetical protein
MHIRRPLNNTSVILELHSNESYNGDFELKGIWEEQAWRLLMFCSYIGPGPNPGIELGIFRKQVSCISTGWSSGYLSPFWTTSCDLVLLSASSVEC